MQKDKTKMYSTGSSRVVLVPADIYKDSSFPFEDGEELEIEILDGKLEVRRPKK